MESITIEQCDEGFLIRRDMRAYACTDALALLTKLADILNIDVSMIITKQRTPIVEPEQPHEEDTTIAKEAMNAHVHVNVELNADEMAKLSSEYDAIIANPNPSNSTRLFYSAIPEIKTIESGNITPIKTDIFKEELKNRAKESCKVFTEIEPFKEVPAFIYRQTDLLKQIGKNAVFCNNRDGIIAIWRAQYKLNIYTTIEEIKRMKALSEMTVKLTLQDYETRTYPNKAVVLRHFLRDLKDVDELKVDRIKPKVIPTFSTMKAVDEVKK